MTLPFRSTRELLRRVRCAAPKKGNILFVGQAYYNAWYLSRALADRGWGTELLNFDDYAPNQLFYHGQDFQFMNRGFLNLLDQVFFYFIALWHYDIFFFANAHYLRFGYVVSTLFRVFGQGAEIRLIKQFGRKVFYGNNGCRDGVAQSRFGQWKPHRVCDSCAWVNRPDVCSDALNLAWGKLRNSLADYQCILGGNRVDYNDDPRVHEEPWFYCLDKSVWRPDLEIPETFRLPTKPSTIRLYHAVGNFDTRSLEKDKSRNVKSTHLYLELVQRLQKEGLDVELLFFKDVPNRDLRYYQAQADIFLDSLIYGFFGATVREGMMLGKPAVCFIRPEWLDSMRREIPEYANTLPVVSALPETAYAVIKDLILNPDKRSDIGRKSRAFAEKWHASDQAALHFESLFAQIK